MKTSIMKKSLLDYAIKGKLTSKFRRENPHLSAFDEIADYNEQIAKTRKAKQKALRNLEKESKTNKTLKPQIATLKKEIAKLKEIEILNSPSLAEGVQGVGKESSDSSLQKSTNPQISVIARGRSDRSNPQKHEQIIDCHESATFNKVADSRNDTLTCHTERSEVSKNKGADLQNPLDSSLRLRSAQNDKIKTAQYDNAHAFPFEIPKSWAWVKLGDICEMKKGPFGSAITKDMFIPKSNEAIKIYEQKNAIYKNVDFGEYYISLAHFEKLKQFEVFADDIIVSCAGTIGESYRIPKNNPKGIINQALMKISLKQLEWIAYFLIVFDFLLKEKSQENSKGSAIKNIPELKILKNFLIPLPPLNEQQAIAQKLESLIALANEFEATQENLKRIEKRIEKSLLHYAIKGKLSSKFRAENPSLNAFDEIADYNEQIAKTRKAKQKELANLEKALKEKGANKQAIKPQIQAMKKEIAKLKEIEILNPQSFATNTPPQTPPARGGASSISPSLAEGVQGVGSCHTEGEARSISNQESIKRDISAFSKPQYDNKSAFPFEIPKSWAWVKLGDICETLLAGGDKPKAFSESKTDSFQIPIYTNAVKENGLYGFTNKATIYESAITIAARGTIGFVCPRYEPFVPIVRLIVIIPKNFMHLEYLANVLTKLELRGNGTSVQQLTIPDIINTFIPLPPKPEQESIAKELDTLFSLSKGLRVE